MSLIKVSCYVLRVKNMHFGSPSDSWDPCGKAKPSYVQYIIRQGEAELCILELTSVFHQFPSVGPKQMCALAHLGCTCEAGTSYYCKNIVCIVKTLVLIHIEKIPTLASNIKLTRPLQATVL